MAPRAAPLVEGLAAGADLVITGRIADPALALAPLIHEFGWGDADWSRLGAGTLVEIRPGAGPTFYVAFTRECVPKIDLENGRVVVILPEETESPKEGEAEAK